MARNDLRARFANQDLGGNRIVVRLEWLAEEVQNLQGRGMEEDAKTIAFQWMLAFASGDSWSYESFAYEELGRHGVDVSTVETIFLP